MRTIIEIRRENLQRLVDERNDHNGRGGQAALARETGKYPAQFAQWLRPSSDFGNNREISNEQARHIEVKLGLTHGWLDQDHSMGAGDESASIRVSQDGDDDDASEQIIDGTSKSMGVQLPPQKRAIALMLASAIAESAGTDRLSALAPMLLQLATPPPDSPSSDDERLVLTAFRQTDKIGKEVFLIQARHALKAKAQS